MPLIISSFSAFSDCFFFFIHCFFRLFFVILSSVTPFLDIAMNSYLSVLDSYIETVLYYNSQTLEPFEESRHMIRNAILVAAIYFLSCLLSPIKKEVTLLNG